MKKKYWRILLLLLMVCAVVWVLWANTAVELNAYIVIEKNLPAGFDGFRIAHISDLHSAGFYMDAVRLLADAEPDVICITGDLMDQRDDSVDVALDFAAQAVRIAPCYYITGNHEARLSETLYKQLLEGLDALGVIVLEDSQALLRREEDTIAIAGHFWGNTDKVGEISGFDGYRILLSHQPEDMDNYSAAGYDLVLTGHAHGGQFRLPFLGGVYAPGQGFFPRYTSGVYTLEKTDMVVSRGIGNSTIPLRLGNRPEVVLVILECGENGS